MTWLELSLSKYLLSVLGRFWGSSHTEPQEVALDVLGMLSSDFFVPVCL